MRQTICVIMLVFVVTVFSATSQSEPGQPVGNPVQGTDNATPQIPASFATHMPPDDGGLPGVLGGTLPPTGTPFPTLRVTPTLNLPTSQPPPGCTDCGGQQPGIVFSLLELFLRFMREFN